MSVDSYPVSQRRSTVDLDLSRNERPRLPIGAVGGTAEPGLVSRYPDTASLRAALAARHDVPDDRVLVTAGGDDALLRCALARLGPGRTAVTTTPTFQMIPLLAAQAGSRLVEVEWWDRPLPVAALATAAAAADAVFLVSPNNPTGTTIDPAGLREISRAADFVVLDAAYGEFADVDVTEAALQLDNVVVVRTLSKAYGLAGLRVGYLLGPPDLIAEVGAYGTPYPVAAPSAAMAIERLDRDGDVAGFVSAVRGERSRLATMLAEFGIPSIPSQANFVLAEVPDAGWTVDACAALGVGVRAFSDRTGLDGRVRITLPGNPADFARLTATLTTVLSPEALLFDLDGVLVDVERSYRRAIVETAAWFGVSLKSADIAAAKAAGDANDDWELTRRLMSEAGVRAAHAEVAARFEERYHGTSEQPGLKEAERPMVDVAEWRRLAKVLPIGVVTGRPRRDAVEALDRFDLLESVSTLVTREDAAVKPDPAPVRLALERLSVGHAWMVGDTPDDLRAARAAGVLPIGLAHGGAPADTISALSQAARIITTATELERWLP
jgi:histidinol-phosphate aminotransferase